MKQFLLNLYAKRRARRNPISFALNDPEWYDYMSMSMGDFSRAINKFPYKADRLKGLLDKTEGFSHFIDPSADSGRDCDDFARMWSFWGLHHGYKVYEVLVTTKKHFFKNSHVVTILGDGTKYTLCNYRPYRRKSADMDWLIRTALKEWDPTAYGDGLMYSLSVVDVPIANWGGEPKCQS